MEQTNKPHRAATDVKKTRKGKLHANGQNAKAFAVAAPGKLDRMARRAGDLAEKKLHAPVIDRTPEEPPPVIVAVVGPPGTGKTTLIKSLVKRYTKQTLSEIKGPVTVVSGKRQRLTFIECQNDLNSMIDLAKIADLVLLLIDGNFGFEMETMEFLNILAPHGFPRIMAIATHLDLFKSQPTLRDAKKRLKRRIWTELYQGAKLFHLSGVMNGRYPDREILNLSRFISVMKFRPLKWRNEHPYLLADRLVDITHPAKIQANTKIDRTVTLYGYLHGTPLPPKNARVHIPGVGDLVVTHVERLPDPCPTPEIEKRQAAAGVKKRKRLDDKQKRIYAPMSNVGGILVDKDAVYVDIHTRDFSSNEPKGPGERMIVDLQNFRHTSEDGTGHGEIRLTSSGQPLTSSAFVEDDENTGRKEKRHGKVASTSRKLVDENDVPTDDEDAYEDKSENLRLPNEEEEDDDDDDEEGFEFADSDSDLGEYPDDEDYNDDERAALKWKSNLAEDAKRLYHNQSRSQWDIGKLMYIDNVEPAEVVRRWRQDSSDESELNDDEESGNSDQEDQNQDFFVKKESVKHDKPEEDADYVNMSRPYFTQPNLVDKWADPESISSIASRFMSSSLNKTGDEDEDEGYEDFEDLEDDDETSNEKQADNGDEPEVKKTIEEEREENAKKKKQLQLQFEEEEEIFGEDDDPQGEEHESWYDAEKAKIAKQLEINKAEYEEMDPAMRDRMEGYRAGTYVRLEIENVPCEFLEAFDPRFPVVIGGLLANEDRFGFMKARIKRHRWYKKILKSNDPLILSLGWRRFQTIPIYTTSDSRTRNRMLKYTPEHMHCFANLYGPLVSPNTSFCAFTTIANDQATTSFRVAATGTILEVDQSIEIVKKLKLVGTPFKIYKNTAFIKDMFNSSLEVTKFEGARIKTVSGIKGEIKRAIMKPEGCFRAAFEDRILMSDIVFLRAWYPIKPRKFYNPVTSLLQHDKDSWHGMKLTGQVRHEMGLQVPQENNSAYHPIERATRHFNPLRVSKSLQANLPYKSQITAMKPHKKQSYLSKRAVVLSGSEKKARELLQKVMTLRNDKVERLAAKKQEKLKERQKEIDKISDKRREAETGRKKEYFRTTGKRAAADQGGRQGGSKRGR